MHTCDGSLMTMVGRDGELGVLAGFVTADHGQSLVLKGETGVGKSALLDHVAQLAARSGHMVVRAAGIEAETGLPFAGLHQLLYSLLPSVDGLDQVHRTVFATAFGRSEGKPPSVMSLGIAVLDLLSLASSAQPLLLVLDDGHWLDAASVAVLGFVGRRLTGGSVRLVVALRSDVASDFDTAALPELPVPALSDAAAAQLLDRRRPELAAPGRRLVLDQARGNPLALLELPAPPGAGQPDLTTAGALGLRDAALPLPRRLQQVYGTRIRRLDAQVRAELLRGALDGAGTAPGTASASRSARYLMRDADEAVTAGLLDVDPLTGDFVFRHPLVRSTVVQTATPNERRAAHADLARLHRDDVERRATHLAASTVDPDEEVAAALEAAATSATRRGGAAAAVAWLTRAAELSEGQEDRSRRLADAAFVAGHAGLSDQAQRLVRSDRAPGADESPASVVTTAYLALFEEGDVRHSHRQVTAAIEKLHADAPRRASTTLTRLVNLLLAIDQYASDPAQWEETRALLDALGELVPARSLIYRDAWGDVVRHGAGVAERVDREFTGLPDLDPWDITRLGVAAYHVDTLGRYRPYLQRTGPPPRRRLPHPRHRHHRHHRRPGRGRLRGGLPARHRHHTARHPHPVQPPGPADPPRPDRGGPPHRTHPPGAHPRPGRPHPRPAPPLPPPRPPHPRRPRAHHLRPRAPPAHPGPPRRRHPPLRDRPHPTRPRHPPTAHPGHPPAPHRGPPDLRTARGDPVGRAHPGRTRRHPRDRRHRSADPAHRPHLAGTPHRRTRRHRPHQQGDR
ncbi:AAA family ATPase [Streptomyces flavalbus]|uniref:AAA family ATPase n=1 Tax=Streptomyces flavalbus TaxID=2665155 RepID=A0ABW2WHD3_9ACTN